MDNVKVRDRGNKVRTFNDLVVWQKAHQLVLQVYRDTQLFPREETYGLTSQIRRAAASTASNIVEGSRRKSKKDFAHFLNLAQGSNEEVKYFLLLSKDLNYLTNEKYLHLEKQTDEIGAMLYPFALKLNSVL